MDLPLDQVQTLRFVNWLISVRKAKHGTICSYLAGLRQLHIVKGMEGATLRSNLVNLVLAGKRNKEVLEKKKGTGNQDRLPVTMTVMKLIKATIRDSDMTNTKKLTTWAICCLAFNGAFRIHELLSRREEEFDPSHTLLRQDIKIVWDREANKEVILVLVKWPKEDKKGTGVEVEVYETGSEVCPVKALRKCWKCTKESREDQPAFRQENGKAWTGRRFNEELKKLLGPHMDDRYGKVTAHSFRSGVTSMLGRAGYSDAELQAVGRWSSRAFEHYVKLPRSKRREMAREIAKM